MRLRIAAVIGAVAACAVVTGVARAENVTIAAGPVSVTGYMARPSGSGPFPAVLVLHGCEGMGALETQTADELASAGYIALAIDTLKPQGLRNACGAGSGPVRNAFSYATAALQWLGQQPAVDAHHLGVVGYSMGAIVALSLIDPLSGAAPPPIPGLRAVVAYYPACSGRSPNINTPLLILDGSADDWIPPGPCQALAHDASGMGKSVTIVTYPGATHAFNQAYHGTRVVGGHTLTYDPSATADADAKMRAFFQRYLR